VRVAYDITSIDGQPSGVGNYTLHLLTHLLAANSGHEYLTLSNRPGCPEPLLPYAAAPASRPFPRSRMFWMQCVLPGALRALRPHLCHYTNSIGPLWSPCPYVVTIHDMTLSLLPGYHPWRKQLLVRPIVALVARRARQIITVSEHARQDVIRVLRVPAERVSVTLEAAASCFAPASAEERERVRAAHGIEGPYVLYVGTLEPRKNLPRLVRAWHALRRAGKIPHRLVMVGARGWQDGPIFETVRALGCEDAITFTGYVPQADLPAIYSAADAFVFPSLSEGFGLPVVEAMACGTPVLISSAPALMEVAGGAALEVDAGSHRSICDGLERLLTDDALRAALRERGLARAAALSWEQTARQTLQVYRAALAAQPAVDVDDGQWAMDDGR
jgi:glycosyltransferase involved in cell wall biosynthesis